MSRTITTHRSSPRSGRGRPAVLAVVALALPLVAACGSDATPSGATAHTPLADLPSGSPGATADSPGAAGGGASPSPGAATRQSSHTTPTPAPTIHVATPASSAGHATVTTASTGTFTITGSTCGSGNDQAAFFFGAAGSGEEVEVDVHSKYKGAGTYANGDGSDSGVTVAHDHRTWYAQYSSDSGATLTVDAGGRSGSFSYTSQTGTHEKVSGTFACG